MTVSETMKPAMAASPSSIRFRGARQLRHLSQPVILEEVGPPNSIRLMLGLVTLTVFGFIAWASVTEISETTKSPGEVVPSGSVISVQHLEGGIVEEIYVHEGDMVEKGAVLARLAPTTALTQLDEVEAKRVALEIRAERLTSFAEGRTPVFAEVSAKYDHLVRGEMAQYAQQAEALEQERAVLQLQAEQRASEIDVLQSQLRKADERVRIIAETKKMRETLLERGLVSRLVYLQTLDQYNSATGDLSELGQRIARARIALSEAEGKISQLRSRRRNEALDEAGRVSAELAAARESLVRLKDRVQRLVVRSPAHGIVKGLAVNSKGGVVPPGGLITEIVPADEELVVDARVSPADIGHIAVGQKARVKITTYDFSRFGLIDGEVRRISATTFKDRQNEIYYKAEIRLARSYVGEDPAKNRILPGMVSEIDINTGERTVLRYLLRPIYQSLDTAFSER